ncbi:MAG: gamma-glutamyltransferase [Gemmatimonadetes bacterium]|uniref:Glutathione hydrolase proenzyme n=1 Tax=Candidatus Kutchimonas denitrificans TaxID=3056748 RepID=A0AAE4ZBC9_9BACT|nr:gamma-glutamyltransferase [Gemmatimonadota bacterium]NIR74350.1 gamma-glutamyltransferase [Candidatus Kutchimonas denitrificans]NIS02601.1 gamma-glutamyltransferase [Gemmatimonadota bacterium]NIT68476.1 gamma-glutamyltransferase [Gemmatimonadota bacterium]NIU51953.1 gamma-glutamyltransferase [Gemmatimonadota bacterium]
MSFRHVGRSFAVLGLLLSAPIGCTVPPQGGPAVTDTGTRINFPFDWEFRGHEPIGVGTQGMVVTADQRATQVGRDILQAGGNAVDAAVAVGFALAVVMPTAGNIGGGGFAVLRTGDGATAALDFRETAPALITPQHFLDVEGIPTNESRAGHLAVGVPGTVAGLYELHRRYGSMSWRDLLAPAIDLAENGFTVTAALHEALKGKESTLTQYGATRQVFFPGGEAPRVGSQFRQPMLARTLQEIASEGAAAFYRGAIAELIAQEMQRGGGLIRRDDLLAYEAKWRDPVTFDYRGHTIISMPPPSSGGVTMAEALNIVEGYDLRGLGFNSPESIHLLVEAFRRAFADRNYYLGDPDFVDMPIERLTSDEYALGQRASISRNRASNSESFNRVPVLREGANTTHYSIVDGAGNAIALTYTLNLSFGSGIVVPRAGFFLNNEIDDFTIRAGYPNYFGLIQSDANLVAPGKRPLSSMTPTIVLRPTGELLMVLGSPGGAKIITAVTQNIVNVIDFGMDARIAVDAPRVHHQLLPDELLYEMNGLDTQTRAVLLGMGHLVVPSDSYIGGVELIIRGPDGTLYGAADPRREDGRALGF